MRISVHTNQVREIMYQEWVVDYWIETEIDLVEFLYTVE